MNILILTGSFGMGHNSVAEAIKQEIIAKHINANIDIVDLPKYISPSISKALYKGFNFLVGKCYGIYNSFYKFSESMNTINLPMKNLFIKSVGKLLDEYCPDLVISTLPLCSNIISDYKEHTKSRIPLATCITDISVHNEWVSKNTDFYFVPAQEIKESIMNRGVDEKDIYITGIPVRQAFKTIEKSSISINEKRNILIMGGGIGIIPNCSQILGLLSKMNNVETTVITGNNKKAYNKIKSKYPNVNVLGYTKNVHEYMENADILISKAGGITTFESIYSQVPMFVVQPFLEQEINNANYIDNNKIGKVVWNKDNNIELQLKCLINNSNNVDIMKNNLLKLRNGIMDKSSIGMIIKERLEQRVAV